MELPEFLHKLVIQCDLMLKIVIDKHCLLKLILYKQLTVFIEHSMTSTVDVGKSTWTLFAFHKTLFRRPTIWNGWPAQANVVVWTELLMPSWWGKTHRSSHSTPILKPRPNCDVWCIIVWGCFGAPGASSPRQGDHLSTKGHGRCHTAKIQSTSVNKCQNGSNGWQFAPWSNSVPPPAFLGWFTPQECCWREPVLLKGHSKILPDHRASLIEH